MLAETFPLVVLVDVGGPRIWMADDHEIDVIETLRNGLDRAYAPEKLTADLLLVWSGLKYEMSVRELTRWAQEYPGEFEQTVDLLRRRLREYCEGSGLDD